jgi:hypothetical protein
VGQNFTNIIDRLDKRQRKEPLKALLVVMDQGDVKEVLEDTLSDETREDLGERWFNIDRRPSRTGFNGSLCRTVSPPNFYQSAVHNRWRPFYIPPARPVAHPTGSGTSSPTHGAPLPSSSFAFQMS